MSKPVNLKKLTKHWNKAENEMIKICMKHHCSECPFHTVVKGDMICHLGRLNAAIDKLNNSHKYVQIELPEIVVSEERGEKK